MAHSLFQSAEERDVEMSTWLEFVECAYEVLGPAWPSDAQTQGDTSTHMFTSVHTLKCLYDCYG